VQNADKAENREHQWPNTKQVERAASLHWAIILAAFYRRTISQLLICRITGEVVSSLNSRFSSQEDSVARTAFY
jgi:hypothetical protein